MNISFYAYLLPMEQIAYFTVQKTQKPFEKRLTKFPKSDDEF